MQSSTKKLSRVIRQGRAKSYEVEFAFNATDQDSKSANSSGQAAIGLMDARGEVRSEYSKPAQFRRRVRHPGFTGIAGIAQNPPGLAKNPPGF